MRISLAALAVAAGLGVFGHAGAAPIEAYGKLPTIASDQFALSPSGDRIAFVASAGTGRQLVVRELTGKTLMSFNISKNKIRYLSWAGDDHLMLGASVTWNNMDSSRSALGEIGEVFVLTPSTQKAFAVFKDQPKIWPSVVEDYGAFQIDGKWYGYFAGVTMLGSGSSTVDAISGPRAFAPDHDYTDVYRVDLDTGAHLKVGGGTERLSGRAIGPGGVLVARSEYDERSGEWALYPGASTTKVMGQVSPLHNISLDGLGRRPGTAVVVSSAADDAGVYEIDLAHAGARTELLKDEALDGLIHDQNNYLVGAEVERGRPVTQFFDPALQAAFARASKPFGKLNVSYVSADKTWTKWILLTDGDGDSGTYYLVDLAKGSAEVVATRYPDIDTPDVGPVRMIDYKAGDGLALKGVLTLPPGKAEAKNLPVVIMPHGGPESHDSLGFDWMAQAFASQGYAVFQPNFRGSDGASVALRDAGYGEWGRKMQTDLSDGLAELARQGIVDPKRACIVGASYGGYAALAGVTVQHGIYRCAVSYAGPADLNNMLRWETNRYGQQNETFRYWKKFMGAKSEGDGSLHDISPAALASKADAPVLLIHGKNDSTVPIEQSRIMANALRGAGKPVEYVELDGEDHGLSTEATRVQMLKAAVDFVKKNNPPG